MYKTIFLAMISIVLLAPTTGFSVSNADHKLPGLMNEAQVEAILCGEDLTTADHMTQMGFIIRNMAGLVQSLIANEGFDDIRAKIMTDSQVLRTHLTAAFQRTPEKIKNIDPANVQQNKVVYQRYMLKIMSYTIDLEAELLNPPKNQAEVDAQRVMLASIILKIHETVSQAHNMFRY